MPRLLRWSILLLAFVPIAVTNPTILIPGATTQFGEGTMFPYITGKTFFIRLMVAITWLLLAVSFLLRKKHSNTERALKRAVFKNPIFILVSILVVSALISSLVGFSPYRSFLGNLERGGGSLMTLSFYAFLVSALLVFNRKDWFLFLKISAILGGLLALDGVYEAIQGLARVQSALGNPIFLGSYLLFSMFSCILILKAVYSEPETIGKNLKFWRGASLVIFLLSLVVIFLTGTRSVILGLMVGLAVAVVYLAFKGRSIKFFKWNLQKICIGLVMAGLIFIGVFFATKQETFWHSVPGLNRFASAGAQDATFQTRLIAARVGFNSIKPANEGTARTIFGWGPENFLVAYNRYHDPNYLRYENLWFDRSHNQLIDYLTTQGAIGLLAYLGLQIVLLLAILRRVKNPIYAVAFLFFLSAYFTHTFFAFDQISNYIPLFAFIGLLIVLSYDNNLELVSKKRTHFWQISAVIAAVFFLFSFIAYGALPMYQNRAFIKAMLTGDADAVLDRIDRFTGIYTYVQPEIRYRFVKLFLPYVGQPGFGSVVDQSLDLLKEAVERQPHDPREFLLIAAVHTRKAETGESPENYKIAEGYLKRALELSPTRQELLYSLAVNYGDQGNFDLLKKYLDQMLALGPDIPRTQLYYATGLSITGPAQFDNALAVMEDLFGKSAIIPGDEETAVLRNAYNQYLRYYYEIRNANNFLRTLRVALAIEILIEQRLESEFERGLILEFPPKESERLQSGIDIFQSQGWSGIELKVI